MANVCGTKMRKFPKVNKTDVDFNIWSREFKMIEMIKKCQLKSIWI